MIVGPKAENPRAVLARHGLDAKKSWGQNFLIDRTVHERIARAAAARTEDVVVEIGAGVGTLTTALLGTPVTPRKIVAVERDPDMLAVLRAELAEEPRIEIRAEDAVHFDFGAAAAAAGRPVIVVGNLPYQITTALLFAIVDAGDAVARAIVMVQREFAERVIAAPGNKIYGRLSVMVQQQAEARLLFNVHPGAFFPRPRVMSAVMSIARRAAPLAAVRDEALFARVVRETFSTRRKMLRRSLGDAFGADTATAALLGSGVEGTRRPEELTIGEFARLTDALATGPSLVKG
ncbi:MAG: ribosomal RNA small subunit methyltransferase A [Deltaproteobacteria bacterium]|nr:ribosomal RNA small subunit methyltransferase A [Deltaproteobacteria bacterium]